MYLNDNILVAGINTKEEYDVWLARGKYDTGYHLIRIADSIDVGTYVTLGLDYSLVRSGLSKKPRKDMPRYYSEKKVEKKN